MGYHLFAMIPGSGPLSLGQLSEQLKIKFQPDADAKVSVQPMTKFQAEHISINWGKWGFRIYLDEAAHVLEESQEIAARFASHRADRDQIATCKRRIDVASDEDTEMDHFNDYVFIAELLEEIPGAILVEPEDGTFLDEQ